MDPYRISIGYNNKIDPLVPKKLNPIIRVKDSI